MNEMKIPVYEKRLKDLRIAVWQNEGTNSGGTWFNVALTRRYKVGEEWKEAATFNGAADLVLLLEILETTKNWVLEQEELNALEARRLRRAAQRVGGRLQPSVD